MRWLGLLAVMSVGVGCARENALFDAASSGTEGSGSEPSTSGQPGETSQSSSLPTSPDDPSTDDSGDSVPSTSSSEAGDHTGDETGVGSTTEGPCKLWGDTCEPVANDASCPADQRCAPTGEGDVYDSAHCVPAGDGLVGDPCDIACERATSGMDNCGRGLMCRAGDDLTGTCVQLCWRNAEGNLFCDSTEEMCVAEHEMFGVCLPICDPVLPSCDSGSCVSDPAKSGWYCEPEPGSGGKDDACDGFTDCGTGFVCVDGTGIDGCRDPRCCARICDLEVQGDCPEGTCTAFYEEGMAPPGYERVGYCTDD